MNKWNNIDQRSEKKNAEHRPYYGNQISYHIFISQRQIKESGLQIFILRVMHDKINIFKLCFIFKVIWLSVWPISTIKLVLLFLFRNRPILDMIWFCYLIQSGINQFSRHNLVIFAPGSFVIIYHIYGYMLQTSLL